MIDVSDEYDDYERIVKWTTLMAGIIGIVSVIVSYLVNDYAHKLETKAKLIIGQ